MTIDRRSFFAALAALFAPKAEAAPGETIEGVHFAATHRLSDLAESIWNAENALKTLIG